MIGTMAVDTSDLVIPTVPHLLATQYVRYCDDTFPEALQKILTPHRFKFAIRFRTRNIVAVSFFVTPLSDDFFFFNFNPILTANNSGLKPQNLENFNIFRMLWTSAFS